MLPLIKKPLKAATQQIIDTSVNTDSVLTKEIFTKEQLISIGGRYEEKNNSHRVYFNDLKKRLRIDINTYCGMPQYYIGDDRISSNRYEDILAQLDKGFYYDLDTNEFVGSIKDDYIEKVIFSIKMDIKNPPVKKEEIKKDIPALSEGKKLDCGHTVYHGEGVYSGIGTCCANCYIDGDPYKEGL